MKIKLDENIPVTLARDLARQGHDVDTVVDERLVGSADADVWKGAQRNGRFFITQDLDFSDLRKFSPKTHHGLMLVRLARPSNRALRARLKSVFTYEAPETLQRCFVVVTDSKIRIRRPTSA